MQTVSASLRGPRAAVVKYDLVAAINGAGLAKAVLSKDLAQRLTLLIVSRYNWITNELSAGHMQLAALWSVDIRRVKRILADLRALGVLDVKRAGRRGLVTVYRLDLERIADITRPFWQRLGTDIAARLHALFPDRVRWTGDGMPDHGEAPSAVDSIEDTRPEPPDLLEQAIAREVPPAAFERWVSPLVSQRRNDCIVFTAPSSFVASYVERQFGDKIERVVLRHFPEVRRVIFTAEPGG